MIKPKFNPTYRYLCLAMLAIGSQHALAQNADTQNTDIQDVDTSQNTPNLTLDPMVIRFVVPTNVQVLGQKNLKESAAQNIDDMALYEPGVDVVSDNTRLGHQNFAIRGIEGNRILMTVDGIPLPDEQKDISRFGLSQVATRDTIEADTLKQVRIVKGGNGTAQGDGAVGGAVNMQTFSPLDLVDDDKPWHAGVKYGYRSAYRSHGATATATIKRDIFSALAMLTKRKLHETKNYPASNDVHLGSNRTESNHQDGQQNNVLLKFHIDHDTHHLETVAERFTRSTDTELFHQQGTSPSRTGGTTQTPVAKAHDDYKRHRYAITYRYTPDFGFFDEFTIKAYQQKLTAHDNEHLYQITTLPANTGNAGTAGGGRPTTSGATTGTSATGGRPSTTTSTTASTTATTRPSTTTSGSTASTGRPSTTSTSATSAGAGAGTPPTAPQTIAQVIDSHNIYQQTIQGIRPELTKKWQMGNLQHHLLIGGEFRRTQTSRLRTQDSKDGRSERHTAAAYFPPADRTVFSLYTQDNIGFANGANLGLGLRYEMEKSTFDFNHPSYLASTRNNPVKFDSASNHVFLPSLGFSYPLATGTTGSFAYRRGYRSPDVNFSGAGYDSGRGYRVIPNPKLKPESSDNYELGLHLQQDKMNASLTTFYHQYRNFIASTTVTDVPPPAGYTSQFRYDNVNRARTYGVEGKATYHINDNLKALGSFAWINTKNQTTNQPLITSYPFNGVLGLSYNQANWDIGGKLRFAAKNTQVPQTNNSTPYFKTPAYAVFDLTGNYQINDHIAIGAGIYNLTNKKYWTTGDTHGVLDDNQKDRYTQPSRNFAFNAELKF